MTSAFRPVRIGVVGVGGFGTIHARTLAGLAESQLVAVVARRQESLDAFEKAVPGVPGYLDLKQAMAEADVEGWIVACSTPQHVPVARQLLEAGFPALVEKPVGLTLAEARTLAPLVRPDSSNLMVGHILLFNSEFRQLLDEVAGRGRPHYINALRYRSASVMKNYRGESPFHQLMVHDLYCVQALVDRAEPTRFSAQVRRMANGQIDLTLAELQWGAGTIASLAAGFITPDGMAREGFDRTEVFGDGWAARLSPTPRPIEVWDTRAHWPMGLEIRADAAGPSGMMAEELRCFCRVVRGVQRVPVGATYADAMQVQSWLDVLEKAADVRLDTTVGG